MKNNFKLTSLKLKVSMPSINSVVNGVENGNSHSAHFDLIMRKVPKEDLSLFLGISLIPRTEQMNKKVRLFAD